MNKRLYQLILFLAFGISTVAQTVTPNKCWSIDYETWNTTDQPALFIDCGNDEAFNVGQELTIEVWLRAYTFAENRKLMGKIEYNEPIDNGYVLGFENLHVYAEYFNPNKQEVPRPGDGPMPADSSFVHMVTTYSSISGKIQSYVNGILAGETSMFPSGPIVANDRPFIIGNAPWDLLSYQFYGDMDEVRVWNTVRTQEQLQQSMHLQLQGDEEGLVAYYNFNTAQDELIPDMSINGFDGTLANFDHVSTSWSVSAAPVGDPIMSEMQNVGAIWYTNKENFHKLSPNDGITIVSNVAEKEFRKYLVVGNNGDEGTSIENAPQSNPEGFTRTAREWYFNVDGNIGGSFTFNLELAAGNGDLLPNDGEITQYALLYRENQSEDFKALYNPINPFQNIYIFNNLDFKSGYYALAYATEDFVLEGPNAIKEDPFKNIQLIPNPVTDILAIKGMPDHTQISIYNPNGILVKQYNQNQNIGRFDLSQLDSGLYFIQLKCNNNISIKKIIKK
ncbi:MAG: T9SS type A sorting domain-containing protein [Bacteroidales bacterium]|nr:T9SS type A sorting domain-containing protein [Bacteroidales bacterium]